jgi:nucleoside 2-deoxyribosyltransferase
MKVYLGGPINGCTDEEANGWRDDVKSLLDTAGIEYLDPMRRDYRGRELEEGIAEKIVFGDKDDICECSVLLMNCPKPSYGTAMEILYGYQRGARVIAVLPEGSTPSPWVLFHAEVHHGSAVDVVKETIL